MIFSIKALYLIEGLQILGILLFRWALLPGLRRQIDAKTIALLLLVPAVGLFGQRLGVFYGFLVVAMVVAGTSRMALCNAYVLLMPMVPELAWEAGTSNFYFFQFSSVIMLSIGGLIGLLFTSARGAKPKGLMDAAVVTLVVLFTFVEGHGSTFTVYLRVFIVQILQLGAPYLIVSRSVKSVDDLRAVLMRLCLAGTLAALIAIYDAVNHWALYETILSSLDLQRSLSGSLNIRAGLMRAGGPMLNVTAFGFFMAVALGALWAARYCFRRPGYRVIAGVFVLALIASQSRGAWLAAGGAYAVLCLYRRQQGRLVAVVAGSALAYVAGQIVFADNQRIAEALGRSGGGVGTGQYRTDLWNQGLVQVRAHPLFGQTAESLNAALAGLVQGQGIIDFVNAHLYVAMRAGLVGLAIWLMVWAVPFRRLWVSRLRGGGETTALASAPITMVAAAMIGLVFTSHAFRTVLWPAMAAGMVGACGSLSRRANPAGSPVDRVLVSNRPRRALIEPAIGA